MDAAAHSAGLDLRVNSGYRTYAEQASLYQQYLNGTGNLAAPPGTQHARPGAERRHQRTDPRALAWLRKHAAHVRVRERRPERELALDVQALNCGRKPAAMIR